MANGRSGPPIYVFDSSSLIHLERRRRGLDILSQLGDQVVIPSPVATEVRKPRTGLRDWLRRNQRCITGFLPQEGAIYLSMQVRASLGRGESAAIAIALHRRAVLVTEDKPAIDVARSQNVECISVEQLIEEAFMV